MHPEVFSSQERSQIMAYLKRVDESRHAAVIGQAVMEIYKHFQIFDLSALERIYRDMGSHTYFIAMPIEQAGSEYLAVSPLDDEFRPYYLWIEVNGKQEALKQLEQAGTPDFAENLKKLKETGMLIIKPGTQLSLEVNAPNN